MCPTALTYWMHATATVHCPPNLPPDTTYRGLDYSQDFVKKGHQENHDATRFNLREGPLPSARIVVCQVSLFQFYPDHEATLSKLFQAAEQGAIKSDARSMSFRQGMPESRHRDVKLRRGGLVKTSTCATNPLPSMALDSGIPCRNDELA